MADPNAANIVVPTTSTSKPFVTPQTLEQRVKNLEADMEQLKIANAHLFEKEKEEEEDPKKDGVVTGDKSK
jgi:hypothetical protein